MAGLDAHKRTVVACVLHDVDGVASKTVRTFGTTTTQLEALSGLSQKGQPRLDISVIPLGLVSDGQEALAISGRGLRSVKQGRAKALTKLQKKRSRTK